MNTYFLKGSWNVICDRCGKKYKAFQLRKEWTGLFVCDNCWEPRHPQDFIRIPKEDMSVPYVRPPQEHFVGLSGSDFCSTINMCPINTFELNG